MNKIKFVLATFTALGISACWAKDKSVVPDKYIFQNPYGVTGDNGVDYFAAPKFDSGDRNCFYGKDDTIPGRSTNQESLLKGQVIFIGHDKETGSFSRFQVNKDITENLEGLLEDRNYARFESAIPTTGFTPYDYSEFGDRGVGNPLDLKINWYSVLAFVLIEPSETFNVDAPFRTVVSVRDAESPFRTATRQGDNSVIVEYTSLPPRAWITGFETISKRDCRYYYDLQIVQSFNAGAARSVTVPVIIDPGGENDGPPNDGGMPPAWP